MSYDIIPLVITIVCLVGIIVIIVRKFPVLASIDIESIKSEREAKQKEKIIASRLERKVESFKKGIFSLIIPIILKIKRIFKENPNLKLPFRRYEIGYVFRDEPIEKNRYREFIQCDVDTIGSKSIIADAEILSLANKIFNELNLKVNTELTEIKTNISYIKRRK